MAIDLKNMQSGAASVGQTQETHTVVDAYDAQMGTFHCPVSDVPQDELLPVKQLPTAPDPSPFKLGQL